MRNRLRSAASALRIWTARVLIAIAVLFLSVTFTPVVRFLIDAITPDWNGDKGEVLVVLGGSMLSPGTGPIAAMGNDTYLRCVYAVWILRNHSFRRAVVTGTEGAGETMARFLEQNGVAADSVMVESRAGSTYENAAYTKRLLATIYGTHIPAVTVLTSDYHAWRATRVFQRAGFQTRTIPVPDIRKRANRLLDRWPAFLLMLDEFSKDAVYFVAGRI